MTYGLKDVMQASIGAFSAIFVFFLIRGGNPIFIEPTVGFIIGSIWLTLIYDPFKKRPPEHKIHFIGNLIVTMIICSWLSIVFGLVTRSELMSFAFFGSGAWLSTMVAVPLATLFDRRNLMSIFDSYYSIKNTRR